MYYIPNVWSMTYKRNIIILCVYLYIWKAIILFTISWYSILLHAWFRSECILCGSVTVTAVAKAVLDRCMVDNVTLEDRNIMNTKDYKVEFNYEFLDDYCDPSFKQTLQKQIPVRKVTRDLSLKNRYELSDIASTVDETSSVEEVEKNKGFVATWGPEAFSPKYHPLALMVSWLDHLLL